ncbi:MAG: hypothetical protein MJD61_12650 [Proteobacteria bacterium]|nr:hypothetical protein [Pseudomonadota bacterium]
MVDMTAEAVRARIRRVGMLLSERGYAQKGVDMSEAAVAGRLRMTAALTSLCSRLAQRDPAMPSADGSEASASIGR